MRALFACEFYHPSVGGVQEVMRQIAERMVERGHGVTVATSYLPERRNRTWNGVEIAEFKASGSSVRGLSGEIDAYRRYVLASGFDVLMVKAAQQWTFDALLPVLDRIEKPKVFVPCGFSGLYEPTYAAYYRAMPEALAKFDRLLFYASDYRDIRMARASGLSNLTVLANGASEREFNAPRDRAFRTRLGIPTEAFVVLTVGTFSGGMKGQRELAEAFELADFAGRPAVLILNGNTSSEPYRWYSARSMPSRIARRGISQLRRLGRASEQPSSDPLSSAVDRINEQAPAKRAITTDLARPELAQAYLNSDLFVFASRVEYSPLVLFEAAAAGLPFLSVPVGNSEEIAGWTGGGVICPASFDQRGYTCVDPAVLAEWISRLAADPARLASLGRTGRAAWSARFTWDKIADQYEAMFKEVIETRSPAALLERPGRP